MKIFIIVVVLSTNNVGEYVEEVREVSDCNGLQRLWLEKGQPSKWKEGTNFTQLQK